MIDAVPSEERTIGVFQRTMQRDLVLMVYGSKSSAHTYNRSLASWPYLSHALGKRERASLVSDQIKLVINRKSLCPAVNL